MVFNLTTTVTSTHASATGAIIVTADGSNYAA